MLVRTYCCGVVLAAAIAAPAAAQTPTTTSTTSQPVVTRDEVVLKGDTTPRPSMPTINGDTGLWFVPTAETLAAGKWSASVFRANWDRQQGLADISKIGITAAVGIADRAEIFGSWGIVREKRDVQFPLFVDDPKFGGIVDETPFQRRSWSKNIGSPLEIGAKYSLTSQSRGDAISLAPRVLFSVPISPQWSSTDSLESFVTLVASREAGKAVELTGQMGGQLRHQPDEYHLPNKFVWGVGAAFPSRSAVRGLVEWRGAYAFGNYATTVVPMVAEDGSVAETNSLVRGPNDLKLGVVWNSPKGFFLHGGMNFTPGVSDRSVGGTPYEHSGWGIEASLGWHPGVAPAREKFHEVDRTTTVTNTVTTPAPPAPQANRNPAFTAAATCDPCVVEPGQTSRLAATATDPDGDAVTYAWTAPSGTFNPANAANTTWTAPNQEGNVPVTVTARDARGGSATASVTLQVVRREVITFEDVHFDFDRFNLRPDALKLLDDAVAKMMRNPNTRITIEGHCDSVGTSEYNLALGEKRANSVRDYLTNRGVANTRLRTVSYGEDRPIDTNNTAPGRAANRRAHLVVIMETVQ